MRKRGDQVGDSEQITEEKADRREMSMADKEFVPGTKLIERERERQITDEGYDSHHDTEHEGMGDLADAAACYACCAAAMIRGASLEELAEPMTDAFDSMLTWPWDKIDFKPTEDPIRALVKAGALIAAEIDLLQRTVTVSGAEG